MNCSCLSSFFLIFPADRTAAHKDVCFLHVDEGLICSEPRNGMMVTYSECCCHYGRGWGPECNTCPPRHSGEQIEDLTGLLAFLFICVLKRFIIPCVQRCSPVCVRCSWRLSPTASRISWQLLPTTTQVKHHVNISSYTHTALFAIF